MTVKTTSGARIFIGSTTRVGTGSPAFAYEDDSYTEIGEVENLGEFGDESAEVNFSAIGDARVRILKGARKAGTLALVVGRDPLDAGQLALDAAEQTKFDYNFKVIAADAPSEDYTDSVFYFSAPVMSRKNNFGANDDVTKKMYNLGINSALTEQPAETSP